MSQMPPVLPPQLLQYATPGPAPRSDLRTIAKRQRVLMFCILAYLGGMVAVFALPDQLKPIASLAMMAASVTAAVLIFMLAMAVYNQALGIVLGILTLIPFLGLVPLLIVNSRATNLLSKHGYKVGLMGASLKQFPLPGKPGGGFSELRRPD